MNSKRLYLESLLVNLGGKKKGDSIDFVSDQLLIRHKKSRVEYTVVKVSTDKKGDHSILCYRYYGPKSNLKMYSRIPSDEFNDYERV